MIGARGRFGCETASVSCGVRSPQTLEKNGERVVNAFEICWRRMLKIKWTGRITNGEVFQWGKKNDYF
jgi:hypothetical protein